MDTYYLLDLNRKQRIKRNINKANVCISKTLYISRLIGTL